MFDFICYCAHKIYPTLGTVVQTVFLTLKLTNYVSWSWFWVLSPIWVPATLAGLVVMFLVWQASQGK